MAASRPARLPKALSAGGVIYRRTQDGDVEVVICGSTRDGVWRLPKGTPEDGESLERTALREVGEETGLDVAIEEAIGSVRYRFDAVDGVRYDKTVEHYLMTPIGGDIANHDAEFEEVRWVTLGEGLKLLRFANERTIVRKAARLLKERGGA